MYLIFIGLILTSLLFIIIISLSVFQSIFSLHGLIPPEYFDDFIAILPGPIYTDIIFLFAIPIGFYYIHYLLFPYFTKIWYFFHKIIRRKGNYGFVKVGEKISFHKLFLRGFYIGLFSFSITTLISSFSGLTLFRAGSPLPNLKVLFLCEDIFLGTFLLCPISVLFFFPLFQMEDSGFMAYRHLPEYRRTAEIEGIHALLYRVLKGYAGLSTIISLAYYIYMAFDALDWDFNNPAILTPLILITLPFLIMGLLFIPFYLHEKYNNKNTERMMKQFKKLKIIDIPTFDKIIVDQ